MSITPALVALALSTVAPGKVLLDMPSPADIARALPPPPAGQLRKATDDDSRAKHLLCLANMRLSAFARLSEADEMTALAGLLRSRGANHDLGAIEFLAYAAGNEPGFYHGGQMMLFTRDVDEARLELGTHYLGRNIGGYPGPPTPIAGATQLTRAWELVRSGYYCLGQNFWNRGGPQVRSAAFTAMPSPWEFWLNAPQNAEAKVGLANRCLGAFFSMSKSAQRKTLLGFAHSCLVVATMNGRKEHRQANSFDGDSVDWQFDSGRLDLLAIAEGKKPPFHRHGEVNYVLRASGKTAIMLDPRWDQHATRFNPPQPYTDEASAERAVALIRSGYFDPPSDGPCQKNAPTSPGSATRDERNRDEPGHDD